MNDVYNGIAGVIRDISKKTGDTPVMLGTVESTSPLKANAGGTVVTVDYAPDTEYKKGDAVVLKVFGNKTVIIAKVVNP